MAQPTALAVIYLAGATITAGYYLRHASWKLRNGALVAAAWPLYWLFVHGISGTTILVVRSIFSIAQEILNGFVTLIFKDPDIWLFAYFAGVFLTPGVLIYHGAAACSSPSHCAGLLASSIGWGLVWPSYILAALIFAG